MCRISRRPACRHRESEQHTAHCAVGPGSPPENACSFDEISMEETNEVCTGPMADWTIPEHVNGVGWSHAI